MPMTRSKHSRSIVLNRRLDYLAYLPEGYAEAAQPWPLIVFLHGAGERGGVRYVRKQGLPLRLDGGTALPFVVIAPACPLNSHWPSHLDELNILLTDALAKYRVDPTRVYLTGLSMGGNGAWTWGMTNPERFAAVAPICGYGIDILGHQQRVVALKNTPVWAFHGALDPVVSINETARLVKALGDASGDVKFTVYPDLTHNSWTVTYDNPELYTWFLSHRLEQTPA
jgi:predicted peptidase